MLYDTTHNIQKDFNNVMIDNPTLWMLHNSIGSAETGAPSCSHHGSIMIILRGFYDIGTDVLFCRCMHLVYDRINWYILTEHHIS